MNGKKIDTKKISRWFFVSIIFLALSCIGFQVYLHYELSKDLERQNKSIQLLNKKIHHFRQKNEELLSQNQALVEDIRKLKLDLETEKKKKEIQIFHGTASAYTNSCKGCTGITASGEKAVEGMVAMAKWVPLGTKVRITAPGYGTKIYTVSDRGGAIKGNQVDIYMNSFHKAIVFGKRNVQIEILN